MTKTIYTPPSADASILTHKQEAGPLHPHVAHGGKLTIFIAHASDLLTDHLPNGDGLIAFGFVSELARRGHRLHVATRQIELRDTLPSNVKLYPITRRYKNELADRLHYMLAIRRLLRRLRRNEHIDIVHQMNPVFAGLSLGLVGLGIPVVLGTYVARWPGDDESVNMRSGLLKKVAGVGRWIITSLQQTHASALLITTPAAMNRVPLPRLTRQKCHIVRHAIDEVSFAPLPNWQKTMSASPPTILFYSHLDRRKGVFVLVDAFCDVARAIPSSQLFIVGRGIHIAELKSHAAKSGYSDRIHFIGRIERTQAPNLFRSHGVYCLPSFGEPYATTVLEAMSCARPLVITDAGGLPYMAPQDGAVRVPPGNAAALADALVMLLRSPEAQISMGTANRNFIERHYTWRRVGNDLEAVYKTLSRQDLLTGTSAE